MAIEAKEQRYRAARRVTLVSVAANLGLAIGKIVVGIMAHSAALTADGAHSASDLITDAAVLFGMRVASREADEDHPYGHGKYEALTTQFIAVALWVAAGGIIWDAIGRLQAPQHEVPSAIALVVAAVSVLTKEFLYRYTARVGQRIEAKALLANAWHHRSDAISSVAAFLGIAGAIAGWSEADAVAALFVALILAKVGIDLFRDAIYELTDSTAAIDGEVREEIANQVKAIPEVHSAHSLMPRRLGSEIFVDVHAVVDPRLSVSEGHQIADKISHTLEKQVKSVSSVLVHIDTVEDHLVDIPMWISRSELANQINQIALETRTIRRITSFTPHYELHGVVLDVVVNVDEKAKSIELKESTKELGNSILATIDDVVEVHIGVVMAKVARQK
jgi:cation diffusion facilitator family transporter